ncbi:MAG: sigma-54-dependent Fis family transcriptional regulator [Bacillota bacterium]|nr:sigma-54-dependent Fis family transcriptional regulator [Bacillota bacterium]
MSKLWQRFINGDKSVGEVDPLIYRSWKRCEEKQVDFRGTSDGEILSRPLLQERNEAYGDLLQAGKNVLPFLVRYLKGKKYIVLLCDKEGYILKSFGNQTFMTKAQSVYLSPGANWREDVKGTNAIGTALAEQQPVKVLGWEHYVRENHILNCWAAPVRNARGEIIGVLDISGEASCEAERLVEIVLMGARMIEQNLQVIELENNFQFCRAGIRMASEMLREGFVTINSRGEIVEINEAGVQLLGNRREDVIGRSAEEVFHAKKSTLVQANPREIRVDKPGNTVHSRFSGVKDAQGGFLGAVGVLQPSVPYQNKETFWLGRSERTQKLFRRAAKAAGTLSTVLIQGESGTGKEVVARYVHQMSQRKNGPFVALNCAAIPATLIESELFGYAEGSFTGAKRGGQPGKFEQAHDGTIFFDEIGDMPLNVQASLLRVLQEKEIYRVGDSKTRKVNARVLAATNKNLAKLVEQGKFRLDLYYRLKVVSLEIPPLRERPEDILDLVPYFVSQLCAKQGKQPLVVPDALYSRLLTYSWPGNIRELENCIESMVAMAEGALLREDDLPQEVLRASVGQGVTDGSLLEQQTKQAILQALTKTNGKIAPAARLLGIGRTTLYRKLEELNISL